jgi:hypothetical protein
VAKASADLRSLARSHTESAVKTLAGVMTSKDSPPAAQVAAASALLDRGWGKPPQALEHSGKDGGSITFTWQPPQES